MSVDVSQLTTRELLSVGLDNPAPWRPGLPPGKHYPGMIDDFEVAFTVAGLKWHRRRTDEQKVAYLELLRRNRSTKQGKA